MSLAHQRVDFHSTNTFCPRQFCGVNVIAYYSSTVFVEGGLSEISALLASFGFGLINWLFAFPAVITIDTFGRRNLLLVTFPLMSLFLLLTGFAFFIPETKARTGVIALGIYLFAMVSGSPPPVAPRFTRRKQKHAHLAQICTYLGQI